MKRRKKENKTKKNGANRIYDKIETKNKKKKFLFLYFFFFLSFFFHPFFLLKKGKDTIENKTKNTVSLDLFAIRSIVFLVFFVARV